MAVLIWDEKVKAYVELEDILGKDKSNVWHSIPEICVPVGGVMQQVYPTKKYLYRQGDECTAVTGGWVVPGITTDGDSYDTVQVSEGNDIRVVQKQTDAIYLRVETRYGYIYASSYTAHKIELSRYKKLCVDVDVTKFNVGGTGGLHTSVFLASAVGGKTNSSAYRIQKKNFLEAGRKIVELELGGIQEGYIVFQAFSNEYGNQGINLVEAKLLNVWLET